MYGFISILKQKYLASNNLKTKCTLFSNVIKKIFCFMLIADITIIFLFITGDDGKMENESTGLMKESDNMYTLWCSGRTCCEGMLVELKFIKRQDLVAVIAQLMRPVADQVHIKVDMNKDEMDNFVFCVASKKTAIKISKDMADVVS